VIIGDGSTGKNRQGEQQTPAMPSDKAHRFLQECRSSSTNRDGMANLYE
jgi:hypothetical protein